MRIRTTIVTLDGSEVFNTYHPCAISYTDGVIYLLLEGTELSGLILFSGPKDQLFLKRQIEL